MFVYLSKKIAIPNNTKLTAVAWNRVEGYIACGGEDGLLKVLKLENQTGADAKAKGLAAPSNLSMNQTLEGHSGHIEVMSWNEYHQKLTTSDENGLIIVWMLYKGSWYEEMINNRNRSTVRGMKWNADGQKICIVYEDGAVIVGSVDGNRIWGKELKLNLVNVEWSPDGKVLLFALANGEVQIYDNSGSLLSRVDIVCLGNTEGGATVVSMDWYDGNCGYEEDDCPSLLICYSNGRCQLMRGETDQNPILLDTGMHVVGARWNHCGSVLAIAGSQRIFNQEKDVNVVQFYTPLGEHLRTLKVPGKHLSGIAWEGGSLRIALSVDSFIYFANIRPDYKWAFFGTTLVYAFNKPERAEQCVVFYDTKTQQKYIKYMRNLLSLVAYGSHCCLAVKAEESSSGQYILILCNSIGTPMDYKYLDMEPMYLTMTKDHVVAACKEAFYVWQFKSAKRISVFDARRKTTNEKLIHIDDVPTGAGQAAVDFNKINNPTTDPICCLAAHDQVLIVGRESGTLNRYSLPQLSLAHKHLLNCRPHQLSINCAATRLAIVDITGVLTLFDLEARVVDAQGQETVGQHFSNLERKEVWDLCWAADNSELLAVMEKTRMYVLRGLEPEEPIVSSGYICDFKELHITAVLLDDLMKDPDNPLKEQILEMEVKSLRDTRELLAKVGLQETLQFVEENPHPRLWKLLSDEALEQLDLKVAEHAMVRCKDYAGIQFIKSLSHLQTDNMKKAEVCIYFHRFEEAEKIYSKMDRQDLAISMRKRLGDWFRVVQLLKSGHFGDDTALEEAYNAVGEYFADRHKWTEAVTYFVQGRNCDNLADCYYMLEDYDGLKSLMESLPEGHTLLPQLANMFVTLGMCEEAVASYKKCDKVQEAIDICVKLNQWHMALDLAQSGQFREIDGLLTKYASHLMQKKKVFEAIELYRKANQFLHAAKLIYKLAKQEEKRERGVNLLRVKKLYVLGALLIEQHQQKRKTRTKSVPGSRTTLESMLNESSNIAEDTHFIDSAWRGAEAYHFLILAQRHLYSGQPEMALLTALNLAEYEDVLDNITIYSLIALSAASAQAYKVCSSAFIKLESPDTGTPETQKQFQELAMEIFTKHSPKDMQSVKHECPQCQGIVTDWTLSCNVCDSHFPICMATGKPLVEYSFWMCPVCKHRAYEEEIAVREACPFCHSAIE